MIQTKSCCQDNGFKGFQCKQAILQSKRKKLKDLVSDLISDKNEVGGNRSDTCNVQRIQNHDELEMVRFIVFSFTQRK